MEAAPGLEVAIAAAEAVAVRCHTASDEELLADGDAVEQLGRLVDAWRIGFAGEVEHRSDAHHGEGKLALRLGVRDGVELVQQVARVGHREAKRRVALGAALRPNVAITGDLIPGRHDAVGAAVQAGRIGIEAARAIVNTVNEIRARATGEHLDAMVDSLVGVAESADVETVRDAAMEWALALDPDGAEPKERQQRRKRALRLGRTLADGTTNLSMVLTPEDLALVKELLASRRRGRGRGLTLVRAEPGGDEDPETDGPEWRPEGDDRSRVQQDYDTAMDALRTGSTATEPASPMHETVITVTAAEVEARQGQGWAPGIMAGLPLPVIERQACTGGVRLLVTGDQGEPLHLSRKQRLFSPAQRKALVVTAGGKCQFPSCRVPDPYLEAHHAQWWRRDRGKTDIDNGVMLCSFHHHLIHAQDSPVRIERHHSAHHLVPRNWSGPPDPAHRLRTGHRTAEPPDHGALRRARRSPRRS